MGTETWGYWNSTDAYATTSTSTSGTSGTWQVWNSSTSAPTSHTTTDATWHYWTVTTDSTTDATVQTTDGTWSTWVATPGVIRIVEGDFSTPHVDRRRIRVKAKRARIRAEKQRRKEQARRAMADRERQKAEEKAQELLLDLIGPEQMAVYRRTGRVFVKGREFDWLLQTGGNICQLKKIKKGKVADLCIHMMDNMGHNIPKTDQVIGFLLNAKHNERHLAKTANVIRLYNVEQIRETIRDAASG